MIKRTKRGLSRETLKVVNAALGMYLGYWRHSLELMETDPRATPEIEKALREGYARSEAAIADWLAVWSEELGHEF